MNNSLFASDNNSLFDIWSQEYESIVEKGSFKVRVSSFEISEETIFETLLIDFSIIIDEFIVLSLVKDISADNSFRLELIKSSAVIVDCVSPEISLKIGFEVPIPSELKAPLRFTITLSVLSTASCVLTIA